MGLLVEVPENYPQERDYILTVMLREFLGLEYQVRPTTARSVRITADDGRQLELADVLFQTPEEDWLTENSLPRRPLENWDTSRDLTGITVVSAEFPVIYGEALPNGAYLQFDDGNIRVGLDIFGSAFYMLTRYEEIAKLDRDRHERFPSPASLAYQEGFLDRPIVNEYLEVLWACLSRLWPQLRRKPYHYQLVLSHDVDKPLSVANKSLAGMLRNAGGDVVRRKDLRLVPQRFHAWVCGHRGDFDADPCNTFDFIMDTSERHGLIDAFYFITDHSAGTIDGSYHMHMPWIRELMRRIHARGHEIGLHPSYNTFRDAAQTKREFENLLRAAEEEGIRQERWGGRQHYLRWEASTTWQNWEDAGLSYDSTLSYADRTGFRCGVCYEFPTFNLRKRQRLQLIERPLVVMEASLFERQYMNQAPGAAQEKIIALAKICKNFNGQFTLLWHNSELVSRQLKRLYVETVEELA